jgi:hypothetical protein
MGQHVMLRLFCDRRENGHETGVTRPIRLRIRRTQVQQALHSYCRILFFVRSNCLGKTPGGKIRFYFVIRADRLGALEEVIVRRLTSESRPSPMEIFPVSENSLRGFLHTEVQTSRCAASLLRPTRKRTRNRITRPRRLRIRRTHVQHALHSYCRILFFVRSNCLGKTPWGKIRFYFVIRADRLGALEEVLVCRSTSESRPSPKEIFPLSDIA